MDQAPGTPPEGPQQPVPQSPDQTGLAQPGLQQPNFSAPQGPPPGGFQQPPQGGFHQPPQGGFQAPPPQGGFQQPGYGPPQGGFPPPNGFPQPAPSSPKLKPPVLIGAGVLALILAGGAAIGLSGGDDGKKKVLPPPPPPAALTAPPALDEPSAPASPAATGPYTTIQSPCNYVAKPTIGNLVPFTELWSGNSKDGPSADNAYFTCNWESKYQRGAAKQINRKLKVKVMLRTSSEYKDAVAVAQSDYKNQLGYAEKDAGKKNFLGDPYGPIKNPQGLGDEAFSQSSLSSKHKIRRAKTLVRVGNVLIEVGYDAHDAPRTKDLFDNSKNIPGDEAVVTAGAEKVAAEVLAGLKACAACTGPAVAGPDPASKPENAPVEPVKPVWANGKLKGLVDPCALVPVATLDRLVPQRSMQRIVKQGYTSGSDMSTATCVWTAGTDFKGMRKLHVTLTYRATPAKAKQTLGWSLRDFTRNANKTDVIGIKYGAVETLLDIGDKAAVQSSVTTVPLGQAILASQVGNVHVEVRFSGGDGVNPMTPLPAETVIEDVKAAARDLVGTLRP